MKKMFICFLISVIFSCQNNDAQLKEKNLDQTQKPLSNNPDSLTKETFNPLTDSSDLVQISKIVEHGMPILLTEAQQILGKQVQIDTAIQELDFDSYSWKLNNGTTLRFEDINYNEKGIELDRLHFTSKNPIEHPLSVFLNKSTLAECKKVFPNLKKAYAKQTYKLEKNKTWYFLMFNNNNVLIEIKSSGWDTDKTS